MRYFLCAGALALAVACTPPAEEAEIMSEGCEARAASQWAAGADTLSVEATTAGPDCERAVATLAIRNSSGEVLYAEAHIAGQLMTLASARDPAAMQTALAEWVDAADPQFASTAALPEWAAGAESPVSGDFPFFPAEASYDNREAWAALRAAASPVFCYVQGMESMSCVAYSDGGIAPIGVQTFPG